MKVKIRLAVKLVAILAIALGMFSASAQAQRPRASQKGTVSQVVDKTEIVIEYSRPSAKGRILFGEKGIIKYGKIWMPGANEASNIKISKDVLINGKPLKAGRYSFWVIPEEKEWTVIFSEDWNRWHTKYPGKDDDALRLKVNLEEGIHSELMTFSFPVVTADSAKFTFHWGKTVVPFELKLAK